MGEPDPRLPSAYPDDLQQNAQDRHCPPQQRARALSDVTDHARHHQGGGPTGAVGGDRPAENVESSLVPIDGRDILPGADPQAHGEAHWDAPLPGDVRLSRGPTLRTLRDAGDFLSGRHMPLETSEALQETARVVVRAARTGTAEDVAEARNLLQAYVNLVGLG